MDNTYQKNISFRIITRAETGLYFLEHFLYNGNAKDAAWFRSICILLSYSFELILKARVTSISKYNKKEELEKELRDLGHDIVGISAYLGEKELENLGIKSIKNRNTSNFVGYIITTTDNKEIVIEDFIEIRYDFMNDSLRNFEENETVKMYIEEMIKIAGKVKKLNI